MTAPTDLSSPHFSLSHSHSPFLSTQELDKNELFERDAERERVMDDLATGEEAGGPAEAAAGLERMLSERRTAHVIAYRVEVVVVAEVEGSSTPEALQTAAKMAVQALHAEMPSNPTEEPLKTIKSLAPAGLLAVETALTRCDSGAHAPHTLDRPHASTPRVLCLCSAARSPTKTTGCCGRSTTARSSTSRPSRTCAPTARPVAALLPDISCSASTTW